MAKKSTSKKAKRTSRGKRPAGTSRSKPRSPSARSAGSRKDSGLPASAHRTVDVELGGDGHETYDGDSYVGEILDPFNQPDETRFRVQSGSFESASANLELMGAGRVQPAERFVDAWHGTFGTHVSSAMASGQGGVSVQEMMAEVIIGQDDRIRVNQTTRYPFSALCSLEITAPNQRVYVGTGWLIDPVTVITAGHCVYLRREGGWASSIKVYPGRNGTVKPHTFQAISLMSVEGWVHDGIPASDYGAIRLDRPVTNAGTFGFRTGTVSELMRFNCHVIGYPADKRGEMWGHVRRLKEVQSDTLVYDVDTYGGNSGGPIIVVDDGDILSLGIHNYGDLSGNSATRITDRVFDNLESWKAN